MYIENSAFYLAKINIYWRNWVKDLKGKAMKQFLSVAFRLFLFILVIIGCDEDTGTEPSETILVSTIELTPSRDVDPISNFSGEYESVTIEAIACDSEGVCIENPDIEFSIFDPEPWKGTITPIEGDSVANDNFVKLAKYEVILEHSGEVAIEAHAGRAVATLIIILNVLEGPPQLSIEVENNLIRDHVGESKSIPVTATVCDGDGAPVPGIEVEFSIRDSESWKGTITPLEEDSVTNESGEMHAVYEVDLERSGEVIIEASSYEVMATTVITLVALEGPFQLFIEAENSVLVVFPDQIKNTIITATLFDSNYNLIPGQLIHFYANPSSHGRLDSTSGITNDFGQIQTEFSTVPNMYGICDITARLDGFDLESSVSIEILQPLVASIELRVTHNSITGFVGEAYFETVTAIARNANDDVVPGVTIQFGIQDPESFKGTISTAPADSVTDENGQIIGTYAVVLERDADVVISARYNQLVQSVTIRLSVLDVSIVGDVSIEAEQNTLAVPRGETAQTGLTVNVVDTSGLAIPEIRINLRVDPAYLGYLDSDTGITDINGNVLRTFYTIADLYGLCTVYTMIADITDSTVIEIREP